MEDVAIEISNDYTDEELVELITELYFFLPIELRLLVKTRTS